MRYDYQKPQLQHKASKALSPQLHMDRRILLMPSPRTLTTNLLAMLETCLHFNLIGFRQAILYRQVLHNLLGRVCHVRHVFVVAVCEDQVDFFEGAVRCFVVERDSCAGFRSWYVLCMRRAAFNCLHGWNEVSIDSGEEVSNPSLLSTIVIYSLPHLL